MPVSPLRLLLLVFVFGLLTLMIEINLLVIALDKLGLTPASAMLLVMGALSGSVINLPLMRVSAEQPAEPPPPVSALLQGLQPPFDGTTLIAVNVGGCIIPVCFSLYLILHNPLPLSELLVAIATVSFVSYRLSRPVPGLGIAMPALIAPVTAAIAAVLIDAAHGAPLAYISGTLGVLIGADLLRMKDVRKLGAPLASIGGAGTFDGIFITGMVAALLA